MNIACTLFGSCYRTARTKEINIFILWLERQNAENFVTVQDGCASSFHRRLYTKHHVCVMHGEKNHPARFYSNKFSVRLSHLMYVSDGFCASSLSFHSHMVVGVVRPNIYGCLFHFRFSLIFSSIHWNLHGIVSFHFPLRSNKRYEKGKVLFSHFLFA